MPSTSSPLIHRLTVRRAAALPGESGPRGHVKAGTLTLPCALGRTGVTHRKREGDKATPARAMAVLHGFFRRDRLTRPFSRLPLSPTTRDLGWCDDPAAPTYNRLCRLPTARGHEELWRSDGLYDIVLVLDYNLQPRRNGRGSAIFMHCARAGAGAGAGSGLRPTLGCVALRTADLRRLLGRLAARPVLVVL